MKQKKKKKKSKKRNICSNINRWILSREQKRKITLFRNGDRYFAGKQIAIKPKNYTNLGQFLQDLSSTIDLPYGVRRLFTPNKGSEITDVNILKDGASYVCASFEPFQKLEYAAITLPRLAFNIEQCKSVLPFLFLWLWVCNVIFLFLFSG